MKYFNTVGPVNQEDHYCVPLTRRLSEPVVYNLIEQKKYFILHAPRQSGKTSAIMGFVKQLNQEGIYTALYINTESAHVAINNIEDSMLSLLVDIKKRIDQQLNRQEKIITFIDTLIQRKPLMPATIIEEFLTYWAKHNNKPLVLFFDEADALVGDTLIALLKQIRSGYPTRPQYFPQTICLVGVRNLRDYHLHTKKHEDAGVLFSPFNIVAENVLVKNFSHEDVRDLYNQHTQETGQKFDEDAINFAFELTQGQPWLVNALAYQACFLMITDRSKTITKEIIEEAKNELITRRDTHINSLVNRLQEKRVRNIIDAILAGNAKTAEKLSTDDILYVRDLGLIKSDKGLEIANPIYKEIIPRELTYAKQQEIIQDITWYKNNDGTLNMTKLLEAFTKFYRDNAVDWLKDCDYKESGPHLLLMAFLQRVINGGGSIWREYALGSGRTDLLIELKKQRFVIEIKIWHGEKTTIIHGLEQIIGYMDTADTNEGHLVIFNRSQNKTWEEKIYTQQETVGNKKITIWGM